MFSKQAAEFAVAADPEAALLAHLSSAVTHARENNSAEWRPGEALELWLSGYFGAGNVGSDMRSGEILRQLRFLLGDENVNFSALSSGSSLSPEIYPDVRCLAENKYTPEFLSDAVSQRHGVIACEGSMFKSTFSNVLSALLSSTLGMAAAQGKIAVGYGAEVSSMDDCLRSFVRENTGDALILCRNAASLAAAQSLGLRALKGADTAWTFHAASAERAKSLLKGWGWNGSAPIVTVCPINPFWWPVRADPKMAAAMHSTGAHREIFYGSVFFHADSLQIRSSYQHYIEQLAQAMQRLVRERDAFPLILAMEHLDERACRDLSAQMGIARAPILGCEHKVADVIAVLRCSSLLISSRFHALVGAMPAAVPSIGISMDERINHLLGDSGESQRVVKTDAVDLADQIVQIAARLDAEAIAKSSKTTATAAVKAMGEMGIDFVDELKRVMPEFPVVDRPRNWQAHLPLLPAEIQVLLSS